MDPEYQRELMAAVAPQLREFERAVRHPMETQGEELSAWLDSWGELAGGGTLLERVKRVVTHYATQGGRWERQRQEADRKHGRRRNR